MTEFMERRIDKKFPCGCFSYHDAIRHDIKYCPKHKAAPDMYEALKALADSSSPISPKDAHKMADKAIRKAEEKQ